MSLIKYLPLPRLLIILCLVITGVSYSQGDISMRLKLADKYFQSENYDKAFEEYRRIAVHNPDNLLVFERMGKIRMAQKRYRMSAYYFGKALKFSPGSPELNALLAKALKENGEKKEACAAVKKINNIEQLGKENRKFVNNLIADPACSERVNSRNESEQTGAEEVRPVLSNTSLYLVSEEMKPVVTAYSNRDYTLCLNKIHNLLDKQPGHPGAYYYGGLIRRQKGEIKKALYNFKRSLNYKPMGFNANFYIGLIYENELSNPDSAVKYYEEYLRLTGSEKGKTIARNKIDNILSNLRENENTDNNDRGSREFYEWQLDFEKYKINPEIYFKTVFKGENADVFFRDATGMLQKGRYSKAESAFKREMNKNGRKADAAAYNYAVSRVLENDLNSASSALLKINKENIKMLEGMPVVLNGYIHYVQGMHEKARINLVDVLKKNYLPENIRKDAFMLLGDLYYKNGKFKEAAEHYERCAGASSEGPEKVRALFAGGKSLMRRGEKSKAFARLEQALSDSSKGSFAIQSAFLAADGNLKHGNLEKSLELYNLAESISPNNNDKSYALYQCGNILKDIGKYVESASKYSKLIEKYPDTYWAEQAVWKKEDALWCLKYGEAVSLP